MSLIRHADRGPRRTGQETIAAGVPVAFVATTLMLALSGCATTEPKPEIEFSSNAFADDTLSGTRLTSDHFVIISTLQDKAFERQLPRLMETLFAHYRKVLPLEVDTTHRLTSYVLGSRREFLAFTQRKFPGRYRVYRNIRAGGFSEGSTSVSFHTDRSTLLAILAHEGWHQYVGAYLDRTIPAWINEGLACTFETVRSTQDGFAWSPDRNSLRMEDLRGALTAGKAFTLPQLLDADAGDMLDSADDARARAYYAQSWALITFVKERYAEPFDALLADIAGGSFGAIVGAARLSAAKGPQVSDGRAAFLAYIKASPETLSDEFHNHMMRLAGF